MLDRNGEISLSTDVAAGSNQIIEMFIYHYCVLHVETSTDAHVTLYEGQSLALTPTTNFETQDGKRIYAWIIRKNNLTYFLNLSSANR